MRHLDRYLSPNPAKAAVERFWLWYTPVWGTAAGIVMVGGFADNWTDVPLMIFSLVLAAGAVVGPIVRRHSSQADRPWHRTTAFRLGWSVVLISFLGNYVWCPFFYDVLHMHYGFKTQWNIMNNPIQMYVLTVAYFATYCVICLIAWRAVRVHLARAPRPVLWLGIVAAPFAVAGLETALNANPFIDQLFCYDDLQLVLTFGTLVYGIGFIVSLPVWIWIDERPGQSRSAFAITVACLAAIQVSSLAFDFVRWNVAPHFTTVEHGAWKHNLRDYGDGCLAIPDDWQPKEGK